MTTRNASVAGAAPAGLVIRPFEDADYPAALAVHNASEPDNPLTEDSFRYYDTSWDYSRYARRRFVAERGGLVVGYGQYSHMVHQFHPDKYYVYAVVAPQHRRQGAGSALYDHVMTALRERGAIAARTETKASDPDTLRFLEQRGFHEVRRQWQSRLDVSAFDFAPFASAQPRVRDQGIILTTYAQERERHPGCERAIYALDCACGADEPAVDPVTPPDFDLWRKDTFDRPNVLPEAMFLAKDGDRYVGLSFLYRHNALPGVLNQHFTAVDRDHRGRGIAMALKLEGLRYAQTHGYREIRTGNDSLNHPMLRINEALGFVKEPVEITFQKDLTA